MGAEPARLLLDRGRSEPAARGEDGGGVQRRGEDVAPAQDRHAHGRLRRRDRSGRDGDQAARHVCVGELTLSGPEELTMSGPRELTMSGPRELTLSGPRELTTSGPRS